MRIHTVHTRSTITAAFGALRADGTLPLNLELTLTEHRSASHPRAFEVSLLSPKRGKMAPKRPVLVSRALEAVSA